jgi:hypothetical protein
MREPTIPKGKIVERGYIPCVKCGKPHHRRDWNARQKAYWAAKRTIAVAPLWTDPKDGHAYAKEDAAVTLRRIYAAMGLDR